MANSNNVSSKLISEFPIIYKSNYDQGFFIEFYGRFSLNVTFLDLSKTFDIPVPDPKYKRIEYKLSFDELDEIIKNNPDEAIVDLGGEHFIATHDVKDILY